MAGFTQPLKSVATKIPETLLVMVMGTDGIPIEKIVVRPDPNLEAVAAEYTTLLRSSLAAASDTGLGELLELSIVTERMTALIIEITSEYFVFGAFAPGTMIGRARYALRLASFELEREFV
jgi:predicted regulator of Ras-like GTPase activity (Roadblock/LC7/MglB family)